MSYTAKPPFAGMQNNAQNQQQQQQQGGQTTNPNVASGVGTNLPMNNNPNLSASSSGPNLSALNRQQLLQQQQQYQALLLQQPLILQQSQQYYQQLQQQQGQQNAHNQQQQQQQQAVISRMVSDMQKKAQQSNGNLNQTLSTTQQLQQLAQLQAATQPTAALLNMLQQAHAVQAHQQKPFQQQSVPLPSNTTITPVARQNLQASQHPKPVNYPKPNVQSKQSQQSSAQPRRNAPINAKTSPFPSAQSINASLASPKAFGGNLPAAKPTINALPANAMVPNMAAMKSGSLPVSSQPIGTNLSQKVTNPSVAAINALATQKKLPETLSVTPAVTALSVKTLPSPSASNLSPKKSSVLTSPLKTNAASGQTSPRTKQTPRKNCNPIRTNPTMAVANTTASLAVSQAPITTAVLTPSLTQNATTPTKTQQRDVDAKPINLTPTKTVDAITSKSDTANKSSAPVANTTSNASAQSTKIVAEKANPTKTLTKISPTSATAKKTQESAKPDKSDLVNASESQTPTASQKTSTNTKENAPKVENIKESSSSVAKPSEVASPTKVETEKKVVTPRVAQSSSTPIAKSVVDSKVKRNRLKTIPYQSPTPEIELVSKISANEANNSFKSAEDKLILFYRNEFLAVRNADGGFFLCQANQNVYKSSPKIRIRWLSEEKSNQNIYTFDFYDSTDIECVLTTVSLEKQSKGKFALPKQERERVENILRKALDVEKGVVPRPDVTEENPDGLDISLYKNESQIEKKTPAKRKSSEKKSSTSDKATTNKTPISAKKIKTSDDDDDDNYEPTKRSAKRNSKGSAVKKVTPKIAALKEKPVSTSPKEVASKSPTTKSRSGKSEEVQSTPATKKPATKRKLLENDEQKSTSEKESLDAPAKESTASDEKSSEPETKVGKIETKSIAKTNPVKSPSAGSSTSPTTPTSGRATRRTRN